MHIDQINRENLNDLNQKFIFFINTLSLSSLTYIIFHLLKSAVIIFMINKITFLICVFSYYAFHFFLASFFIIYDFK